jgi:hypothetical protein
MNLSEIIGDEGAYRVVSFELVEDCTGLWLVEECDEYYSANLTKEQVGRLIAWLQEQHAKMV